MQQTNVVTKAMQVFISTAAPEDVIECVQIVVVTESALNEITHDGTEASPIISGGEILYTNNQPSVMAEDEYPF